MTTDVSDKKEVNLQEKKTDLQEPKVVSNTETKTLKNVEKEKPKNPKKRWISRGDKKAITVLTDEEKNVLLDEAKISLWIDSYDEIFSDFDPRGYSKREISADFLSEAKRFSRERLNGKVELVILTPTNIVNKSTETVIKKRLMQSFSQQYKFFLEKKNKILKQGIAFILLGIFFMIATTFILFNYGVKDFFIYFLAVIGEPAGWFLFWEGLNLIVFDSKGRKPDLDFNRRMSKINITFKSYE